MPIAVVTGAYSFTGRFIAQELLGRGWTVRTLTNSSYPGDPMAQHIDAVFPLQFDDLDALGESLDGTDALFNTYWIRYPHAGQTFDTAVENTGILCRAARDAGVASIVQVGVAGAARDSRHPYLARKWQADEELRATGVAHAIVQPTLIFGSGDVLLNNISWMLRRIPAFFVPGDGHYPIQPVAGEDVARVCVDLAEQGVAGQVVDVGGPKTYEYLQFVRLLRTAVGSRPVIARMPAPVVLAMGRLIGRVLRDVVVTRDELHALTGGTLASPAEPIGRLNFETWLDEHGPDQGRRWIRRQTRHSAS